MYRFFRSRLTPLLVCLAVAQVGVLVVFRPVVSVWKRAGGGVVGEGMLTEGWQGVGAEQLSLSDSEPLYLPTPLNYGHAGVWRGVGGLGDEGLGGAPVGAFSPVLHVRPGVALELPSRSPFVVPPLDVVLPLRHWGVAVTLGRGPQPPGAGAPVPRQAFMRVESMVDGELVFEEAVSLGLSAVEAGEVWRPVAFSLGVDLLGVLGPPVFVPWTEGEAGSGNAVVDAALRRFMGSGVAVGARLRPGRYRVIIGP
ncbi:MAG: hypothetical protein LBD14_00620 [Puniceicoccales bacterium]|nr:hypothetical protein [Puniceicoccales bacterium]